jgi:hypothetical protein
MKCKKRIKHIYPILVCRGRTYTHTQTPFYSLFRDKLSFPRELVQERLKSGHNKANYGTKQGDILGQEKLILYHIKMYFGTK